MAAAVLLALILGFIYAARTQIGRTTFSSPRRDGVSATLSATLREAEMINAYSPALKSEQKQRQQSLDQPESSASEE